MFPKTAIGLLLADGIFQGASAGVVPSGSGKSLSSQYDSTHVEIPAAAVMHWLGKRATSENDTEAFLKDTQNWYWAGVNTAVTKHGANPTVNLTGPAQANEKYLSVSDFEDATKPVVCGGGHLDFAFKDATKFNNIQQGWSWMNQGNNTVCLVTEPGTCGNPRRQPYQATHVTFDNQTLTASVTASNWTWKDALPDWHIHINTAGVIKSKAPSNISLAAGLLNTTASSNSLLAVFLNTTVSSNNSFTNGSLNTTTSSSNNSPNTTSEESNSLDRRFEEAAFESFPRALDADFADSTSLAKRVDVSPTLDLTHTFNANIANISQASIDCTDCSTRGSLDLEFDVSFHLFSSPHISGTASITPSGVGVNIELGITVSTPDGAFELSDDLTLADIPLPGGLDIAGVASIGPQLVIEASADIIMEASLTASSGVAIDIPDDSVATVDFEDSTNNAFNGWVPTFAAIGPTLDASADIQGNAGTEIRIEVDAEILGEGLSAGLKLAAPVFSLNAAAQAFSEGGVCGDDDAQLGVEFDVSLGAELDAFGGVAAASALSGIFTLLSTATPIFSTCVTVAGTAASAAGSFAP
ncbi:hypothetical protein LTR17_000855 [Elasticomyces elasticus]|nr:hypothetical protein LTR17_000855 [Elasticomyces elasticus]